MSNVSEAAATSSGVSLEGICSIEDLFHRHVMPFLSCHEAGILEGVSPTFQRLMQSEEYASWKVLCGRDFPLHSHHTEEEHNADDTMELTEEEQIAPLYSHERQSFDTLQTMANWKDVYRHWYVWHEWTAGGATAYHMVEAIQLWTRLKAILLQLEMHNILESLCPCLDRNLCGELRGKIPSSLLAFWSVHGGQSGLLPRSQDHVFFAGLLGSYSCYNQFYSMRLLEMDRFGLNAVTQTNNAPESFPSHFQQKLQKLKERQEPSLAAIGYQTMVGMSPGNPRMFLYVTPTVDDPEGIIQMAYNQPISGQSIRAQPPTVGTGGILSYFKTYADQLEAGYYKPTQIIPESLTSRGLSLFPDAGDLVSRAVTRGVEVRASARWFPSGMVDQQGHGLCFGYSIRIQLVQAEDGLNECQLVGRHWEFVDGNGRINRVDGEAVIGKQPLFFREESDGSTGFVDLGPAGDGSRYRNRVFVYQSQSGQVSGTSMEDTQQACVRGTFSFMPGSIANPRGPSFHVTVATFPLKIPSPFY